MTTARVHAKKATQVEDPLRQSDEVVAEVVEALLEPDRAHHSEIGKTVNGAGAAQEGGTSPREQPAVPIDVESAGK